MNIFKAFWYGVKAGLRFQFDSIKENKWLISLIILDFILIPLKFLIFVPLSCMKWFRESVFFEVSSDIAEEYGD